ncbi:kinase-like domain-containing protein [Auriculariales sp. MPI-PUGE-AT-0066]|nr:kinase-like domain-containing protein [Auriculariales sp. MPI-PUGE-AT-0066]
MMSFSEAVTCFRLDEDRKILGSGGYSVVYRIEPSGRIVVIRKSRVSLKVQRTFLRHEARVLQLVQDHHAFPRLVGNGRAVHFDFLTMELLGDSVKSKVKEGIAYRHETVSSIGLQMLSALRFMHLKGIVHRDVKPENILFSLDDTSRVCLIDLGLGFAFSRGDLAPNRDPQVERRHVCGTLNWCSLHAHAGSEIRP